MINAIVDFILRWKMRKCRSIWRAMKRGHPVDFVTGCYRSREDTTILKQVWKASIKRALKEQEKDESGSDS